MTEKWPTYEVADDQVIHALGVMNINYVRFERTHVWMLAATGNMTEEQAAVFVARSNPTQRETFIQLFLGKRQWPPEVEAAIKHYLKAMHTLTENRNTLLHGNIVTGWGNAPTIFSLTKKAETVMFQSSLHAIRQAADEAEAYFRFDLALANYIATEVHGAAHQAGMIVVNICPELPPLPESIRL
jgi:hypothetical protein